MNLFKVLSPAQCCISFFIYYSPYSNFIPRILRTAVKRGVFTACSWRGRPPFRARSGARPRGPAAAVPRLATAHWGEHPAVSCGPARPGVCGEAAGSELAEGPGRPGLASHPGKGRPSDRPLRPPDWGLLAQRGSAAWVETRPSPCAAPGGVQAPGPEWQAPGPPPLRIIPRWGPPRECSLESHLLLG